jgi:hypothetical protein
MTARQILRDQRGVALPMAMIVMVLLTSLMLAFAMLAQTEPVIAHNQLRTSQARAQAEAGFERAVWALSQGEGVMTPPGTPGPAGSLKSPLDIPVPAPYTGVAFVANGNSGGFQVRVTSPDPVALPHHRIVTSTGWSIPAADARTKSHRRIQATVERFPNFAFQTPCALCVRGDLGVGGNALVDGTADTDPACAPRKGAIASGDVTPSGSAIIRGPGGDPSTTEENIDYVQHVNPATFNDITLDAGNFKQLRELAKKNGTYFGPGSPNGTPASSPAWTGSVDFSSSNKLKSGMVFIDTLSGNDIPTDVNLQNASDFANVTIHGNPFLDGDFSGWIVVNGSLNISGNMKINGLVYAVNDFTYNGTGTGEIVGLAISQNIRDTNATSVSSSDSTTTGNSRIKFNCNNIRPPSGNPIGYALVPGTYRECEETTCP